MLGRNDRGPREPLQCSAGSAGDRGCSAARNGAGCWFCVCGAARGAKISEQWELLGYIFPREQLNIVQYSVVKKLFQKNFGETYFFSMNLGTGLITNSINVHFRRGIVSFSILIVACGSSELDHRIHGAAKARARQMQPATPRHAPPRCATASRVKTILLIHLS